MHVAVKYARACVFFLSARLVPATRMPRAGDEGAANHGQQSCINTVASIFIGDRAGKFQQEGLERYCSLSVLCGRSVGLHE